MLSVLLPILFCLGSSSSAPPPRNSRSLEPEPYLPPGEPYLPPLNTVHQDPKDYIPPVETSIPIANGPSEYVGTSVRTECGGDGIANCQQEISLSVSNEPCGENQPCSVSHQPILEITENDGYFYPKPANPLIILPRIDQISRSLEEGLPLEEEVTTTSQPLIAETERDVVDSERSRRGTSKLQTSPEHGPVKISTLPFNVRKPQEKTNINKKTTVRKV